MAHSNPSDFSFEIDIAIQDPRWEDLTISSDWVQIGVRAALKHAPMPAFDEISIALVDDQTIQSLNQQYRGKDRPTNVLSFAAQENINNSGGLSMTTVGPILLGDIILAYETVQQEAQRGGIDVRDHIRHLLLHGFLHLCGYDHIDDADANKMEAIEIAALADLGIANPYDKETYCER